LQGYQPFHIHLVTAEARIPVASRTSISPRMSDLAGGRLDVVAGGEYEVLIEMFDSLAGPPIAH
jgi:hypothetical protein